MALSRLCLKNLSQRYFSLASPVGIRAVSSPTGCLESEIRMLSSSSPTASEMAASGSKTEGREVAVSESGGKSKLAPKKRWGGRWWNRRDSAPLHLNGLGNALLQMSDNLNKIFENLVPSQLFGRFKEDDKCYKLRLEVPGLNKEDIKITIEDRLLTIKGENIEEEEEGSDDDRWSFRSYGYYNTCLVLPDDAMIDEIKAELKNGILHIMIPRSGEQKIEVKEVKIQ